MMDASAVPHRSSLFVLATLLLAVSPVCADSGDLASHDLDRLVILRDDARAPSVASRLQQNPDATVRLVVPDTCEADGERELRQMAAGDELEESYVYVPSLCLWIEVGRDETSTRVRLDTELVTELAKVFPSLAIYHTHVGVPATVSGYFPAYADLIATILVNARFLHIEATEVAHRAVSVVGVIDVIFEPSDDTRRLVERLERTGLREVVAQNLAYAYFGRDHEARYHEAVTRCERIIDGRLERFAECFPLRSEEFVLRFRTVPAEVESIGGK